MKCFPSLFAIVATLVGLISSVPCFAQQPIGIANSHSQYELFGWLDYQPAEVNTVGLHILCPDGTASFHLALVSTGGSFASVGEPIYLFGSIEQLGIQMVDLNSNETLG